MNPKQHNTIIKALRVILICWLLAACSNQMPVPDPTGIRSTEGPTRPSTSFPQPTRTVNAATTISPISKTSTISTATSTAPVLPTATLTPLPTIDSNGILGLIDHNGGCQLPCWWGIEPGSTTKQQAHSFLKDIPANISPDGDSGTVALDGKERFVIAYQIRYELPGSAQQGTIRMIFWDDIVSRIAVGPETTQYRLTIDQLLLKEGKPSQVFIEAKHDAMGYTIPFHLILYYPDRRFFANFYIEAENIGQTIRACPAEVAPGLILWSPEYKMENRLAIEMLGPDSRPGLQPLKDATGLTIDDFYSIFSKPGFRDCLESPLRFWEDLY